MKQPSLLRKVRDLKRPLLCNYVVSFYDIDELIELFTRMAQ
jgi:hypothetical protein